MTVTPSVHPRVLGLLGRALSLELTAVQQYMTQASLLDLWGDSESAERFRKETVEEMQHAESIVQRMLQLGAAPAASQLRPVSVAADLLGLLEGNIRLEDDLIHHYAESHRHCTLIGDGENAAFFETLLNEERAHGRDLEEWLKALGGSVGRGRGYAAYQRARF
ncbi:bacterioferritin [Synechococcus sp. RSCCF101]|uniref:ferritin-like domain-containing protein n=1 Tax=Synechococcus sp. RSCCF101 TaxID=2511069 RepID=UPI0012443B62|nr:ferritin-like domain-containing protein [Synechococcus sp. RSCCF101]QEY31333.1 bacterioferritin [Synechococcus sp. RSCCF101]